MRSFSLLMLVLLGFASKNTAQTVTTQSGYSYSGNIIYKSYQNATVIISNSVGVMGLVINDAGGDTKSTTLTAITFSISAATGNAVRTAALYNGNLQVASTPVTNGDISISFSSASLASAPDGGTDTLELRVTFKRTVIDNQQMQFSVSSVTAAAGGSLFDAADGGAATSSFSGNNNKIIVTADKYKFGQQPTDVFAGQIIGLSSMAFVTVKAVDVWDNVDSDYVSQVKLDISNSIPSCDTLAGNLVSAISGTATFPVLTPNVADFGVILTAFGILPTPALSNAFDVNSAQYNTLMSYNFTDGNSVADAGTNPDYLSKNISVTGTNALSFGNCGCTGVKGPAAYTTGWSNGSGSKFWQMDFSTLGYWSMQVNSRQRSTLTGPRDFQVEYKIGSGAWQFLGTVLALRDSFRTSSFLFPPIDTPSRVYVRWIMTSNTNISGGTVDNAGENYIDDISISGIGITLAKQLYYRSKASGTFESSCSWESSDNAAGPWSQAKGSPDFSSYNISILAGHTITVNQSISLDQVTIDPGATLMLNTGDLHILNGANISGLYVKGTFIDNSANTGIGKGGLTFSYDGKWQLGSAGTVIKTNNSNAIYYRNNYYGGMSAIPSTANWIIRYTGVNSPSFTTDSTFYPNLTIESTNGSWNPGATAGSYFSGTSMANGAFATVKGNLDIGGASNLGTVKISNVNKNPKPLLVQGDAIIRAGNELNNIIGSSYGTGFEIKGNLGVEGILTVNGGGQGTLKLSGSALQTVSGAGTVNLQNLSVANTGTGISVARDLIVGGIDSLIQGTLDPGINTLTLNGPIVRTAGHTGNINGKANTTVLNGASLQTIPSNAFLNNTIKNLSIGNNVALADQDSITGTLSFTGNDHILTTNNNLTLKSTAAGTAAVSQVINGNNITGEVIVERYISARRAWRFLSVPTQTTQSFHGAWQENMAQGSGAQTAPAGYGTQITNNTASWSADGFDYYSPDGPSVKKYNQATNTYLGIAKTSDPIATNEALMTFVRGDRTAVGLYAGSSTAVLRTKGSLYIGSQPTITVNAGKFTSVGNPYAAPLDMRTISKSAGVADKFYVYDPNLGSLGAFQTFLKIGNDYYPTPGSGSYPSQPPTGAPYNFIASGSGFFVTATANGTITFKEDAKASSDLPLVFRPVNTTKTLIRVNLYAIESIDSSVLVDGVLGQFDNKFNNAVDDLDAVKMANLSENLAVKTANQLLVVERRHTIEQRDTIQLDMLKMKVKSYRFEIKGQDFDPALTAFLEDSYNNTRIPLNINGTSSYIFNVENIPGSWNPARFRIVFASAVNLLPNTFSSVKASQQNKEIVVEWKVNNEKNVKQYEVEKSANGLQFSTGNTVSANNNSSTVSYQWTDINPLQKDNYYRVKSIGINGEIQYSSIVKVFMGESYPQISVYPNPVINGLINIQLVNQPEGIYKARLINGSGQVVQIARVLHSGGSSTQTVQVNKNGVTGNYTLEIITPSNSKINNKILVQ